MLRSLHEASDTIRSGEVVGIFAEGQITRIGQLLPFRRGFERIMKGVDAPIIPVHSTASGAASSASSAGVSLEDAAHRFPIPLQSVSASRCRPPRRLSKCAKLSKLLQTDAFMHRKTNMRTLHRSLIRTAHRFPFRFAMG